jgi:hypothetical protein
MRRSEKGDGSGSYIVIVEPQTVVVVKFVSSQTGRWLGWSRPRMRRTRSATRQSGNSGSGENESRRGEQRLRGWAPRSRNPFSSTRPPSWHLRKRIENVVCLLFVISLVRLVPLGTCLGGWRRKACNAPPSRGQRRGNGRICAPP